MSKRFKTQDYFRYKKLGKRWRRPVGLQSKLRRKKGGSGLHVSIGYGSPGKKLPAIIFNENDFQKDCTGGVLIGSTVGSRKAVALAAKAKELGLTVANMRRVGRASRLQAELAKNKEKKSTKEKEKQEKEKKTKVGNMETKEKADAEPVATA